jgi:hypothetical protein
MIVSRTADGSRLVAQSDSARLAAAMLRLFRVPELVGHPRRELLLRAVSERDNGWWEADSAPRRDPSATTALDFRAFPPGLRQEVLRRGIERFAGDSSYLAALLATHALRLARQTSDAPSWTEFRTELEGRREQLLADAGESLDSVARDADWLALADSLSLAASTGDASPVDVPGWRVDVTAVGVDIGTGTVELGLQPFPLAGATTFELSCRTLGERRFESDSALGVALISAPRRQLRVRLRPL